MFGVPLHRLLIYLPIVLAVAALAHDGWAVWSGQAHYHETGSRLSKWAALTALIAVATGFSLAGSSGLGSGGGVTGHAAVGSSATLILAALVYVRYAAENQMDRGDQVYTNLWLAVQILATGLVGVTALIGFRL
jgi:uncharacterized membrane protein